MKVVFSTGAGISIASGLRAYRGEGGLWTENPELEAKSSKAGVVDYLDELWNEWGPFREKLKTVEPNEAHLAIARLQMQQPKDTTVITQNVDGLHYKALIQVSEMDTEECQLFNPTLSAYARIHEVHGNVWSDRCSNPECEDYETSWDSDYPGPGECVKCGHPTRPDVCLFGEAPNQLTWGRAQGACLSAHLFIAVGTSGTVYPASELVSVAKKNGARTILVNTEQWDYPHPDFDEFIQGKAEEVLPDVIARETAHQG